MKKHILCIQAFLLCLCISGCSEKANTNKDETNTINQSQSDDGYKPMVRYREQNYWLGDGLLVKELPTGFEDSGKTIAGCESDAMTLPKIDTYTTAKNCVAVGSKLYVNEEQADILFVQVSSTSFVEYKIETTSK